MSQSFKFKVGDIIARKFVDKTEMYVVMDVTGSHNIFQCLIQNTFSRKCEIVYSKVLRLDPRSSVYASYEDDFELVNGLDRILNRVVGV